jgi:RND superfamily putative drug exporter
MLAGNSTLTQMGFAIAFGIAIAAFVMALFFTRPSPPSSALTALVGPHRPVAQARDTASRPAAPDDDNQRTFAPVRPS